MAVIRLCRSLLRFNHKCQRTRASDNLRAPNITHQYIKKEMDRQIYTLCVQNQLDPHIALNELRALLEYKKEELSHYQMSLRFKIDTFRMFHSRQPDNFFNSHEMASISTEATHQLNTIESIKELVAGIFKYICTLQVIYFRKLRIQGGPSTSYQ